MKITITIDLGNETMQTPSEVANAIHKSLANSDQPLFEPLEAGDENSIRDGNGNTVGKWEVQ